MPGSSPGTSRSGQVWPIQHTLLMAITEREQTGFGHRSPFLGENPPSQTIGAH